MTSGTASPRTFTLSALILLVQSAYLGAPGLRLTLPQAARYFGVDRKTVNAVMATLAEAGVIGKDADGAYVRWLPRVMGTHPTAASARHAA
jgi:hypothetical protein